MTASASRPAPALPTHTPSAVATLALGEHTCADERWAHTLRRRAIDAGRNVSLIAYDGGRDVYVWDVLN